MVDQHAGGEAVAHGLFAAWVAAGGFDQIVVELVQKDKKGELIGVGEGEPVRFAPPMRAIRGRAGDVRAEQIGVLVPTPKIDEHARVRVVARAGKLRAAAVTHADGELVVPIGPGVAGKQALQPPAVQVGGVGEVHLSRATEPRNHGATQGERSGAHLGLFHALRLSSKR